MTIKVLAADDSQTMRKVLEMTFAAEDVEIVTVDSGDAAIAQCGAVGPNVVIADATMATDGYAVAQAIKANHPGVSVLIMASKANPYDEARGGSAGVDDHILKPFDSQVLIDKVGALAGVAQTGRQPGVAAAPPAAPRPPAPAAAPPPAPPAPPRVSAASPPAAPPRPAAAPPVAAAVAAPPPIAAPPKAAALAPQVVSQAAANGSGDMAGKLAGLGLTNEQIQGVMALSKDVIEQVVWEVVPDLAETIIREEIRRLTA